MSAPDPEKWKASVGEIEDAAYEADSEYGNGDSGEIVKLTETVARRRAIEELKALVSGHCTYCALGFELLVPSGGDDGYHMVGPEGSRCQQRCDAYGIIYRIAAIEAEEA